MSKKRNKKFYGADDIYLTERSIAIRRIFTVKGRNGKAVLRDKTTYIPLTASNYRDAKRIYGQLRKGRT